MSDLIQIRKLNANTLVRHIAANAMWLSKRLTAPYQEDMPSLDWQDEKDLRLAIKDIEAVLKHDAEITKRIEAA